MWGKYYYISSQKKIVKTAPEEDSNEMFVQFAMQPLVQEYRKIFNEDIIANTNKNREGHRTIKNTMFKMLPIDKAILGMVVR